MNTPQSDTNAKVGKALEYCVENIEWYEDHARRARILQQMSQSAVVILGGLTPILVLWSGAPEVVQALPAALAAITAGISGFFRWQDNWIRFGHTAEVLKAERIAFETRTTQAYRADLGDQQVLDNFVVRIRDLTLGETSEWRERLSDDSPS